MSSLTVPIPPDHSPACRAENTLRCTVPADLLTVFRAAVTIAGKDMGAPRFLRMLKATDVYFLTSAKLVRSCGQMI